MPSDVHVHHLQTCCLSLPQLGKESAQRRALIATKFAGLSSTPSDFACYSLLYFLLAIGGHQVLQQAYVSLLQHCKGRLYQDKTRKSKTNIFLDHDPIFFRQRWLLETWTSCFQMSFLHDTAAVTGLCSVLQAQYISPQANQMPCQTWSTTKGIHKPGDYQMINCHSTVHTSSH